MERVLQPVDLPVVSAQKVWCADGYLFVHLSDGRIIGHPLSWYPKLLAASPLQLEGYELWKGGTWIHWEELDEDLSAEGFIQYLPG